MKKCVFCGYQLENEDKFCPQCGNKVKIQEMEGEKEYSNLTGHFPRVARFWTLGGILVLIIIFISIILSSDFHREKDTESDQEFLEKTNEVMTDSGIENISIVYNETLELYGLYNVKNQTYIIEPQYSSIEPFSNNLASVCKDEHYGYINPQGEVVINFFFDSAQKFRNNAAIVMTNDKMGVINEKGDFIIAPQYSELTWLNDIILVYKTNDSILYGLCDNMGNIISEPLYTNVSLEDDYIYAALGDETDEYFLYSKEGVPIFGEGTELEQVRGIKINPYGYHLALCQGNSEPNVYGFYYSDDVSYIYDQWYSYLNEDFQMLSYGPYEDAGQFSSAGYAVVSIRHDWWGHCTWGVINKEGTYICDLPELDLGKANNWYTSCNGYFAIGRGNTGSYGMEADQTTALVNIKTGEINEYQSIEFVDTTNYTIVQDIKTNLYGMYEYDTQILECIYDSISFDKNNNIVIKRGAEQETISIENKTQNNKSTEINITPVLIEKALEYMKNNYISDNITELEFYSEENGIISCYVHSSGVTAFFGIDINKETKEVKLYNSSGREIDSFTIF